MKRDMDILLGAVRGERPGPGTTPEDAQPAEAVPDEAAGAVAPVLTLMPGKQMTPAQQARANAGHALRAGRKRLQVWKQKEGSVAAGLMAARPRSYAEQAAYAESHEWATKGHEGDVADLLHTEFANLIGKPGTAIGLAIAALSQHWVAAGVAFLLALGGVETLLAWAGQATAVVWLPLSVVAVVVINYLIVAWIAARDREAREQQPRASHPSTPPER